MVALIPVFVWSKNRKKSQSQPNLAKVGVGAELGKITIWRYNAHKNFSTCSYLGGDIAQNFKH